MAGNDELMDTEDQTQDESLETADSDSGGQEAPEGANSEEAIRARLKESISVEKVELGGFRMKLAVTVPREVLDERLAEQFSELRREALVPGFRRGHAPLRLVEKRFATDVGDQIKAQLVSNGYLAAVEKEDIKPLGDPLLLVRVRGEQMGENQESRTVEVDRLLPMDEALPHLLIPKEGPFRFSFELELKPQFELCELKGIPVTRPRITISDADVETELKHMRILRGTYRPVEGDSVERDDLLFAEVLITVDGQEVFRDDNLDLSARDQQVWGLWLEGFASQVIGKRTGDQVSLDVKVPADHEQSDIRDRTARVTVTLREIKRMIVPPFDEEFLRRAGYESEDELRRSMRSALESRRDEFVRRAMHAQIGTYLLEKIPFDLPQGVTQRQTNRVLARRMMEMYRQGMPKSEIDRSLDELRTKAQDQSMRDLRLFFVLDKIAEERQVEVPEERLNLAIAQIAQRSHKRFDRVRDELNRGDGLSSLYLQLRDEMVIDDLLGDATISDVVGPDKSAGEPVTDPA